MGTLFGGTLMASMACSAFFAASRRARGTVVTRKVDELDFRVPIFAGDFVGLTSRVETEGRTSMTVLVEVHRESPPGRRARALHPGALHDGDHRRRKRPRPAAAGAG